jgi:hypothetical protein
VAEKAQEQENGEAPFAHVKENITPRKFKLDLGLKKGRTIDVCEQTRTLRFHHDARCTCSHVRLKILKAL